MLALAGLLLGVALSATPQEDEAPADPAPPKVRTEALPARPEPRDDPALTRHGEPRPRAAGAVDEDWPGFLGPRRDGRSLETGLLRSFETTPPRLLWEVASGEGWSAPSVADGVLVYPHRLGDETVIEGRVPATGALLWTHRYPTDYRGRYIRDSGPRATPTIDGDRVYVHGAEGRLTALDLYTGTVLWARHLAEEFQVPDNFFGVVASPLIHGERLILNLGASGGPGIAAFDKVTGRLVWGAESEWGASCASPILGVHGGAERLFVMTGGQSRPPVGGLVVLDPTSGRSLYRFPFRSRTYESVNGATPIPGPDYVFLSASYGSGSALLEVTDEGTYRPRWKKRQPGLQFSTPLLHDGRLLALDGKSGRSGALVVLDPKSGDELQYLELDWEEEVWRRESLTTVGLTAGEGSLLLADGALWVLGDGGGLLRLEQEDGDWVLTDRVSLFHALETWTPPVLSKGLLYVRQKSPERFGKNPAGPRLLCFDLRGDA